QKTRRDSRTTALPRARPATGPVTGQRDGRPRGRPEPDRTAWCGAIVLIKCNSYSYYAGPAVGAAARVDPFRKDLSVRKTDGVGLQHAFRDYVGFTPLARVSRAAAGCGGLRADTHGPESPGTSGAAAAASSSSSPAARAAADAVERHQLLSSRAPVL